MRLISNNETREKNSTGKNPFDCDGFCLATFLSLSLIEKKKPTTIRRIVDHLDLFNPQIFGDKEMRLSHSGRRGTEDRDEVDGVG